MFFTRLNDDCCIDWSIDCQNFVCGNALQDAVFRSLFTESRDLNCNTGGYWAKPEFGSGISRVKTTGNINQILAELEDAAASSLEWMERDGIIEGLTVAAEYEAAGSANIKISFEQPLGCDFGIPVITGEYGWVWNAVR